MIRGWNIPLFIGVVVLPQLGFSSDSTLDASKLSGELSFTEAVELALAASPEIEAARTQVQIDQARTVQATLLGNPTLDLELENFAGGGELQGLEAAEMTATITQPLELGGKRRTRQLLFRSREESHRSAVDDVHLRVRTEVTKRFHTALAAQQRVALLHELTGLAAQLLTTVELKVDQGKVAPVDGIQARAELARMRLATQLAQQQMEGAKVELALLWGHVAPRFERLVGELPARVLVPSIDELRRAVEGTPAYRRLEQKLHSQELAMELERRRRFPDLEVSVGKRSIKEVGESAWVVGVSLPVQVFDRNQGGRRAATLEHERLALTIEQHKRELDGELVRARLRLVSAIQSARTLMTEVVPAAEQAGTAMQAGYLEGKYEMLEVLHAQRELLDARATLLDTLDELAQARADLEHLIGTRLQLPRSGAAEEQGEGA